MTDLRSHVYGLIAAPSIMAIATSATVRDGLEIVPNTPFIVYVFGLSRPEPGWPQMSARRQELTVFVHDDPGDYMRIDQLLGLLNASLTMARSSKDGSGFIEADLIEVSQDLSDSVWETVYRSARYSIAANI